MRQYIMNEAVFELPDGQFEDETVHTFEAKGEHGTIALVVVRQPVQGPNLEDIVRAHVERQRREVLGYTLLDFGQLERAGRTLFEVASRQLWAKDPAYQREAHLLVGGGWLRVIGTGAMSQRATVDACVEHVTSTLRERV